MRAANYKRSVYLFFAVFLAALNPLLSFASSTRSIRADSILSNDTTKTYSLPSATDTLVGRASTDTLTNKSISGSTNTISSIADGSLSTSYIKSDGTRAFTGDQSMGSHKITSVTDPASAQDAATKNYVDTHSSSGPVFARVTFNGGSSTTACNSGTCTIASSDHVTSVVRNAAGQYTITFTGGTFSTTPSCAAVDDVNSSNVPLIWEGKQNTSSSSAVDMWSLATNGSGVDSFGQIICIGN